MEENSANISKYLHKFSLPSLEETKSQKPNTKKHVRTNRDQYCIRMTWYATSTSPVVALNVGVYAVAIARGSQKTPELPSIGSSRYV